MHKYFIKTPWIARFLFPGYVWNMPADNNSVYLTFDDGPHPQVTPWVLDLLEEYGAKASFFCIGRNVGLFPEIYQRIISEGHSVGNHTMNHKNGWKVSTKEYLDDINEATSFIRSSLFRPPYGKIRSQQAKKIKEAMNNNEARIIMWDVLSADFDPYISNEECLKNVIDHLVPGSIVVFHDSEKAFEKLRYVLPEVLKYIKEENLMCASL